jgi:hypothetical protein
MKKFYVVKRNSIGSISMFRVFDSESELLFFLSRYRKYDWMEGNQEEIKERCER